jgi:hypothetical protein
MVDGAGVTELDAIALDAEEIHFEMTWLAVAEWARNVLKER